MLKSRSSLLATRLYYEREVKFPAYKAWLSALTDRVFGYTQLPLEMIGPNSLQSVMRMALTQEFNDKLDDAGALAGDINWKAIQDHV